VVFPTGETTKVHQHEFEYWERTQKKKYLKKSKAGVKKEIDRICAQDPLYEMNDEEKWIIWSSRDYLKNNPYSLTKFLKSGLSFIKIKSKLDVALFCQNST
jgi:hypothetical protein